MGSKAVKSVEPLVGKRSPMWTLIASVILCGFLVGGLTFYAAIVVPAASSVWGATDQGFVTRLVTWRFNAIATPCWLVMLFWNGKSGDRSLRYWLLVMLAIQLGLWVVHQSLDSLLDPGQHAVVDEVSFYRRHQIYLWLTTAQILIGWGLVWKFCRLLSRIESSCRV